MRLRWFYLGLLVCAGCRSSSAEREVSFPPVPDQLISRVSAKFSAPLIGETSTPIILEVAAPNRSIDLAAECIERGDNAGAVDHFRRHIEQFPDQIMIRAYLAELLLKMKKLPEAQEQFDVFIAAAQDAEGPPREHIIHCHTRLMEIAQERDDFYAERLHRGIGMVLLARQLKGSAAGDEDARAFRERLLCKASAELTKAAKARPDEPRPHWYLVEIWNALDQPRSASGALRQAQTRAAFLPLPPAEHRALVLARSALN